MLGTGELNGDWCNTHAHTHLCPDLFLIKLKLLGYEELERNGLYGIEKKKVIGNKERWKVRMVNKDWMNGRRYKKY